MSVPRQSHLAKLNSQSRIEREDDISVYNISAQGWLWPGGCCSMTLWSSWGSCVSDQEQYTPSRYDQCLPSQYNLGKVWRGPQCSETNSGTVLQSVNALTKTSPAPLPSQLLLGKLQQFSRGGEGRRGTCRRGGKIPMKAVTRLPSSLQHAFLPNSCMLPWLVGLRAE